MNDGVVAVFGQYRKWMISIGSRKHIGSVLGQKREDSLVESARTFGGNGVRASGPGQAA